MRRARSSLTDKSPALRDTCRNHAKGIAILNGKVGIEGTTSERMLLPTPLCYLLDSQVDSIYAIFRIRNEISAARLLRFNNAYLLSRLMSAMSATRQHENTSLIVGDLAKSIFQSYLVCRIAAMTPFYTIRT